MKISSVTPPYESYLLLDRVQSVVGYIDAEVPELEAKAGGPGALSILLGADYGWKVYGSGLFTSEAMIKAKPDLVKRFVKAYGEAFDYVIAHPDEAAAITAKAAPGYEGKQDVLLAQLKADIAATFTSDDTKAHGLGWMTKERWQQTLQVMTDQGALKSAPPIDGVFTDAFLETGD
jgi:NitT/TauT family transport system substrate-binding protein